MATGFCTRGSSGFPRGARVPPRAGAGGCMGGAGCRCSFWRGPREPRRCRLRKLGRVWVSNPIQRAARTKRPLGLWFRAVNRRLLAE